MLKTIGFDRTWVRGEGAYLWDDRGDRYLDLIGGFGMFNVGRNNPRVRAALIEALELDLPGSVQLGTTPLPPLLADELLRRTPGAARACPVHEQWHRVGRGGDSSSVAPRHGVSGSSPPTTASTA